MSSAGTVIVIFGAAMLVLINTNSSPSLYCTFLHAQHPVISSKVAVSLILLFSVFSNIGQVRFYYKICCKILESQDIIQGLSGVINRQYGANIRRNYKFIFKPNMKLACSIIICLLATYVLNRNAMGIYGEIKTEAVCQFILIIPLLIGLII